ncbi:MAG: hypothetical protein V4666_08060 [Bacteroidota bacterium]
MWILVGCEESQAVTIELRKSGHEAFSCDLLPCSGGHPEWHIQGDVFYAIGGGYILTQDNKYIWVEQWDMGIFHPTCTYLTTTGNRWNFHPDDKHLPGNERRVHPRFPDRKKQIDEAEAFFMKLVNCNIPKIAIENPRGVMSSRYRKPDQYIHPYQFGDPYQKLSGLWLKELPKLIPTNVVEPKKAPKGKDNALWYETLLLPEFERKRVRSKTFSGIAKAMAEQWTK